MDRTLIIVKPDGVQRGLVGEVIARFERRGLKIVGVKLLQIDESLARRHYAVHEGKPYFDSLIHHITSAPSVVMVLEGNNAIKVARRTMGSTDPSEAAPGTIRADYGLEMRRNLVHGSDSPSTAAMEISLFFGEGELVDWARDTDRWIFH